MGYKQMDRNMTFAEVDLMTSMEHNRSLKMMEKINQIIDWSKIEPVLLKHYTVGTTIEGADAFPPLMLLKAFLLQKWFRIHSDPELENRLVTAPIFTYCVAASCPIQRSLLRRFTMC